MNTKAPFAAEACLRGYMWWTVDMIRDHIVLGSNLCPPTGPNPTQVPVAPTGPAPTSVPATPAGPNPNPAPAAPTPTPATPTVPNPTPDPGATSLPWEKWELSADHRCGTNEADARGN